MVPPAESPLACSPAQTAKPYIAVAGIAGELLAQIESEKSEAATTLATFWTRKFDVLKFNRVPGFEFNPNPIQFLIAGLRTFQATVDFGVTIEAGILNEKNRIRFDAASTVRPKWRKPTMKFVADKVSGAFL